MSPDRGGRIAQQRQGSRRREALGMQGKMIPLDTLTREQLQQLPESVRSQQTQQAE